MTDEEPALQAREELWPDGTPKARWTVRVDESGNDIRHGLYESFHADGLRESRGFYEDGQPAQVWTMWDATGRQTHQGPYLEPGDPDDEPDPADFEAPIELPASDSPTAGRLLELGVVLALVWLAQMTSAVFSMGVMMPQSEWTTEVEFSDWASFWDGVYSLALSLQVFIPLLYIIWKSDLKWSDIGVARPTLWGLLAIAPLLAVMSVGFDYLVGLIIELPDAAYDFYLPESAAVWGWLVLVLLANSLAEEFAWRGYVLARLKQLSGSPIFALVVSSVLFASYHVYQGPVSVPLIAISGLIFGASVLILKRIWPAVVGHTLHNTYVYVAAAEGW